MDDRVAGQKILTNFRAMMQACAVDVQIEESATRECLAPKELVVVAKSGAMTVRVFS
jgi:hypothetical protein